MAYLLEDVPQAFSMVKYVLWQKKKLGNNSLMYVHKMILFHMSLCSNFLAFDVTVETDTKGVRSKTNDVASLHCKNSFISFSFVKLIKTKTFKFLNGLAPNPTCHNMCTKIHRNKIQNKSWITSE